MKKKPANLPRGESMNPEERVIETEARKGSWIRKLIRAARESKGRPDPDKKPG